MAPIQLSSSRSQLQTEKEQQAYKSLFADNVVRQDLPAEAAKHPSAVSTDSPSLPATPAIKAPDAPLTAAAEKPLDFNPAAQPNYWLPEGTVMEAVLTNRLDGDATGPVNCMITTDVYLPGTRLMLIPQGARVLGEASKVASFGQQRLAVAFHRVLIPGLNSYSIPLDKQPPAWAKPEKWGCTTR